MNMLVAAGFDSMGLGSNTEDATEYDGTNDWLIATSNINRYSCNIRDFM